MERGCNGKCLKGLKFIIGLATLCLIIVISLVVYVLLAGRFTPLPDVSDLKIERPEVAPEDNAYTHFMAAIEAIYEEPEDGQNLRDLLDGEDINEDVLLDLLGRNADAIQHVRKGIECDVSIVPVYTYEAERPYLRQWRYLARILTIKSRHYRLEDNYKESVEACVLLLNFGNLIMSDAEGVLNYLVSIAIMRMGLDTALDLAGDSAMPAEEMDRLAPK